MGKKNNKKKDNRRKDMQKYNKEMKMRIRGESDKQKLSKIVLVGGFILVAFILATAQAGFLTGLISGELFLMGGLSSLIVLILFVVLIMEPDKFEKTLNNILEVFKKLLKNH